jgi:hypothetical protein
MAGVHLLEQPGIVENGRHLGGVESDLFFGQPQLGQLGHVADFIGGQMHKGIRSSWLENRNKTPKKLK